MSRIKSLMVCGLIATVGSGCQTARSVTSHVAGWRPFGGSSAAESAELAEAVADAEAEQEQDEDVMLETLKAELASAEESVEAELVEEAKQADELVATVSGEIPAVPDEAELNDFAAFAAQLEAEQAADPMPAGEPVAQNEESAPVETKNVSNPAADSLANQIEQLLSEYEPASPQDDAAPEMPVAAYQPEMPESTEVVEAEIVEAANVDRQSTPVQTADLKQKKDASLIAYDLASFADVSVKRDIAREMEQAETAAADAKPSMDFADWARDTAEIAEQQSVAAAQQAVEGDFPWAGHVMNAASETKPVEKQVAENQLPEKKAALLVDEANETVETAAEPALAEAKADMAAEVKQAKEQALMVSSDMLAALEEALGSEDWKSADAVDQRALKLTPELQEIRSLTRSDDAQVRLRGIRLAFEQTKSDSPLVGDVARLLNDENAIVRTHAASALYHWNKNTDEAIKTLSMVVTSAEDRPAQLAAMFLGDMTRETEQVVPVLETALLSTSGMTSMHVAEALLKHDPQNVDAVARLTELMRHENVEVRWLTAHALGSVQGELQPYAVEALRSGLRDIDSQVRATSALSLGGLGKVSRVAMAELTFISAHGEPKVKDAAHIALECIQQ